MIEHDGVLTYTSRRRWPGPRSPATRVVVQPGRPLEEGDGAGRVPHGEVGPAQRGHSDSLLYVPNRHETWPLQRAELLALEDSLVEWSVLPLG